MVFAEIVRELDDSKFVELKGKSRDAKLQALHDNLWSMFKRAKKDLSKEEKITLSIELGKSVEQLSVSDFAWTKEVADQFYNHPYHKRFVNYLKKNMAAPFEMFKLDTEPCELL